MLGLRSISLRSITANHVYGADISLRSGLNIVQAHNTSGKSTCLQAIIYALGLERSLGPQLEVPLPYAMRQRIHSSDRSEYENVIQSFVELVVVNAEGDELSIRRDIEGGSDRKLIKTSMKDVTSPQNLVKRDFFVHDPGAAQNEDGFHNFFCKFVGWTLPIVPRFDGNEGPLYLETIFPMFFVEQKRGWSSIQGPFPTYLKIQDVSRRVMEFVLNLDAGEIRRERAEIRQELSQLEQSWNERKKHISEVTGPLVQLIDITAIPVAELLHKSELTIEVRDTDVWVAMSVAKEKLIKYISSVDSAPVVTAEQNSKLVESDLESARVKIDELTSHLLALRNEYSLRQQEQQSTKERIAFLEDDLRRNQDALKLKGLGSELGVASSTDHCPTCQQSLTHELMPSKTSVGMAIEENIKFIKSQLDLFKSSLNSIDESLSRAEGQFRTASERLNEARHDVRVLGQALLQPSDQPSVATIEGLVRAQNKLEKFDAVQNFADGILDELKSLTSRWISAKDRLKKLSGVDLSETDNRKINQLQDTLRSLLTRFGFKTFPISEISLSQDNFRPLARRVDELGGQVEQELGFEVSASDGIRLKWALYLALLTVAQNNDTNHFGLVIFDEPGQQEIEGESLFAMLNWAAENLVTEQQLVVATSEPIEAIRNQVRVQNSNIVSFDGFILQPM
jgi:predicted  nucleic acid-binding Zn-ribbon protein